MTEIDKQDNHNSESNITVENRAELIETAVRFLKNPKVAQTAENAKRQFLIKKGLTPSEITLALNKSNAYFEENPLSIEKPNKTEIASNEVANIKPSFWLIVIKWIRNFLVTGCLAFTAYKLIEKRFGQINKEEKKGSLQQLEVSTKKLIESVIEMNEKISDLKESIEAMSKIKALSSEHTFDFEQPAIRTEIQSIKNLLLNRSQFPNLPTIAPVLPQWQLENKTERKIEVENETHMKSNLKDDENIDNEI